MRPLFGSPKERICVALDVSDLDTAKNLASSLAEHVGFFKIGFELFTASGPAAVTAIRDIGGKVFLDLKFHDIPATIERAAAAATNLGISLLNVHASGGLEMMAKAATSVAQTAMKIRFTRPFLLAVTVLTSLDSQILSQELHVAGSLRDQVVHLAKLAIAAGLDGVIASPQEITLIRQACGKDCLIVTPGIRPSGEAANDQRRTLTPKEAIIAGADILVIGRPITGNPNPVDAAKRILDEIA
jgi:orotidine-5'-phosphate decarboxylase